MITLGLLFGQLHENGTVEPDPETLLEDDKRVS
jgi:hypothetical protein